MLKNEVNVGDKVYIENCNKVVSVKEIEIEEYETPHGSHDILELINAIVVEEDGKKRRYNLSCCTIESREMVIGKLSDLREEVAKYEKVLASMETRPKTKGKCAKQETIAIVENHGQYWIGSNSCNNSQKKCPRLGMKTGDGYEFCKEVCEQTHHAEVDACLKAGDNAKGGTLYLIGHTYCCDDCKKFMVDFGIERVIIGELPKNISISDLKH